MIGAFKAFRALFSSKARVNEAVELAKDTAKAVGRWVDELQLTEQERAELHAKTLARIDDYLAKTLSESTAQAITRRILAWGIIGTTLATFIAGATAWWWEPGYPKFLAQWFSQLQLDYLTTGVGLIYFGGHYAREMMTRRK